MHSAQSKSDKVFGVVGLVVFELRRLGCVLQPHVLLRSTCTCSLVYCMKVSDITLAGTNGTKFPAIRSHLAEKISATYAGLGLPRP